jgi:hypothetical protein
MTVDEDAGNKRRAIIKTGRHCQLVVIRLIFSKIFLSFQNFMVSSSRAVKLTCLRNILDFEFGHSLFYKKILQIEGFLILPGFRRIGTAAI